MSLKEIRKTLQKTPSSKHKLKSSDKVIVHIESSANSWNIVAIELAEENLKIPSRRRKVEKLSHIQVREYPHRAKKSTNDWNTMALALAK
jgi:hypothetical protein